jgi:hypothetical protein
MARISLSIAFALLASVPVAHAAENRATEEDAAVIRAALAEECTQAGPGYHVLSTEALAIESDDRVPADWPEAKQLNARLIERSKPLGSWSGFRICSKMLVRKEADIRRVMGSPYDLDARWKNFYNAWPGARGYMNVSLPAYSADGQRAVVLVDDGCGSLCGSTDVVELEKKDGAWRKVREENPSIS